MGGIYGRARSTVNVSIFNRGNGALLKWNFRNGFPSALLVVLLIGYFHFSYVIMQLIFSSLSSK